MLSICERCVTHPWLQDEIRLRGQLSDNCESCGETNTLTLPASDERIRNIFRILLRINFSEWEYDPSIGGRELSDLVEDNRPLLGLSDRFVRQNIPSLVTAIDDITWVDPSEIIPIRNHFNGVLSSLRLEADVEIQEFEKACKLQSYYLLKECGTNIIKRIRAAIEQKVPVTQKFFRARIGVKQIVRGPSFAYGKMPSPLYVGLNGAEISAPPVLVANEGRLNRQKVSVLYVASEAHTAVVEVRPYPGQLVSIAEFACQRELATANFAYPNIGSFLERDGMNLLRTVIKIGDLLSAPVPPDKKELYLVTQMIGDSIRDLGFDAVKFKSGLGSGENIAIFNVDNCRPVAGSEWVEKIESLNYSTNKCIKFSEANAKFHHRE